MFQSFYKHFKTVANANKVTAWKSKELSDESIKLPATSDNSLNPRANYIDNAKIQVKFDGSCSKLDKVTFTHKKTYTYIYIYIYIYIYLILVQVRLRDVNKIP